MTIHRHTAALLAAMALGASMPVVAQVSDRTKVTTHNRTEDGVDTQTTRVIHEKKFKTHHAKRILGVKVGHKTEKIKSVRTTKVDSNGDSSTSVRTNH
jgi:hypothetical protein